MKPLNVLYVACYYKPAYVYGGPVTAVSNLCEALVDQHVNLTVLTTDANGTERLKIPLHQSINVDGVEVTYYPTYRFLPRSYFYSPELIADLPHRIPQTDVVIIDGIWSLLLAPAIRSCVASGVPSVVPLHGQLMPWAMRHRRIKKWLFLSLVARRYLNNVSAFHCASQAELEAFVNLGLNVPAFVIPYGLDASSYGDLPKRGKLRQDLGISHADPLILVLGRLHHVKRPDVVLEALPMLSNQSTHVVYAGPDEEDIESVLRQMASKHGILDRIHDSTEKR